MLRLSPLCPHASRCRHVAPGPAPPVSGWTQQHHGGPGPPSSSLPSDRSPSPPASWHCPVVTWRRFGFLSCLLHWTVPSGEERPPWGSRGPRRGHTSQLHNCVHGLRVCVLSGNLHSSDEDWKPGAGQLTAAFRSLFSRVLALHRHHGKKPVMSWATVTAKSCGMGHPHDQMDQTLPYSEAEVCS